MFFNYLKTASRSLMRHKLFSSINIVGLAIGLAAFILIILFVRDEFSWDGHWSRADDVYRLENTYLREGQPDRPSPNAVDPLKDIFFDTFREVEDITRFMDAGLTVRMGDQLMAQQVYFADANFFDFFDVTFIEGSADTVFGTLSNVVISQRTAEKYFGLAPALGKAISVRLGDEYHDFIVSAVVANPEGRSVIQHDFVVPFNREYFVGARWFTEDWRFALRETYVRFAPDTNIDLIRAELPAIVDRHLPKGQQGQENGRNWSMKLSLVPMGDIHLYGNDANADPDVLYGFVGVALLILMIALVNFLNLSMARTAHRAREVAVRKVLGASRAQVIQQFLGESVLLAFISLLLALTMVEFALPYYNEFLSSIIEMDLFGEPALLGALLLLGIGVGVSAGSFQATYFAMLKPHDVLYSNTASDNGTSRLRQGLVVAQFAISVALMIIAFFVNKQTDYARQLDLGFKADDLIVLSGTNNSRSNEIKQRLLESPFIKAVGRSSDVPTEGSEDRLHIRPVDGGEPVMLDGLPTGPDFFKAYEIPLVAGRYLTDTGADVLRDRGENPEYAPAANIVINEMGAKLLGFETPEAAIGQQMPADLSSTLRVDATIVGVVADFHFDSARDVIRPGIYYIDFVRNSDMSVRIDARNRDAAIAAIEDAWRATYPDDMLLYRTMSELVENQYQTDDQLGDILTAFTLLAVAISCMGLYGLASFTAERRTKEIGIRKVLGARLRDIVALMLWQFSKPILVANLIAWPVAFYFLSDWLNGFAYRVELGFLPFAVMGVGALMIGWLTVASHALAVARRNPISALRHE
ncbi:ABC transporter permease [Kordiimonas lipolytica]|uniref:ABC transporter permease n=1 Tax=Kordiimonas lipolytica TaxID=1662421 RepID=A0ABV8UEQ4_9PROT|nr:ABC transporter permease [Kordiimonas lipolytica]